MERYQIAIYIRLSKEDDKYKEVLLKCISENEKIKKDYEQWWEEVITKYNLNKYQVSLVN